MQSKVKGFLGRSIRLLCAIYQQTNKKQSQLKLKTMEKQLIGLNTYLYTFPLDCAVSFRLTMQEMSNQGTVTEVFIDNEYGFELKLFKSL